MSWLQPSDFESYQVEELRANWPELVPLARLLALALRVEPALLRNVRLHFLPASPTELESLVWFSPLVSARSSGEVLFHPGAARLLANELREDDDLFHRAWEFTRQQTRHWPPEHRLEQELRFAALLGNRDALRAGVQDMLKRVHEEGDEQRRVVLARWSRRTLATIGAESEEARLLGQFAACTLGATTSLPAGTRPQALPEWLAGRVPAPFKPARLAVEIRHDDSHCVLHFPAAQDGMPAIDFPTSLPANLHVRCEHEAGAWHVVATGKRIALAPHTARVWLTTIDGRRYELRGERPPSADESAVPPSAALLLLHHLPEDRALAGEVAAWLGALGLAVELVAEADEADEAAEAPASTADSAAAGRRALRLWTPAARRRLGERPGDAISRAARAALLRLDPAVEAPPPGYGAEALLDLPEDWQRGEQPAEAAAFLARLRDWLSAAGDDEFERLRAELDDRNTPPPRRLEIGDRLAEIGDRRPGVGVREFVIDEAAVRESGAEPPAPSGDGRIDEAERLLAELQQAATEPPRRLEIGDRLAEIGDPRRGVGLDSRGLPDIDWVGIAGGEFVYQDGERRTLPEFRIARYPVTNVQYQAFIDAGGYLDERWWRDLQRPQPEPSHWPQANRPRTNVNWYEAVAFSRWLSAQLGQEVRLPTEVEWERAARGCDGREYPWGNHYESGCANINETWNEVGKWSLGQTTAVGVYPHGASAEGVLDLLGNVWEWCLSNYGRPEDIQVDTSGGGRALRGGAWYNNADYARASYRSGLDPVFRDRHRGFRLLSSSPIR